MQDSKWNRLAGTVDHMCFYGFLGCGVWNSELLSVACKSCIKQIFKGYKP